MPGPYEKAMANFVGAGAINANTCETYPGNHSHGLTQSELQEIPQVVGGKILAQHPADMDELFQEFCQSFNGTRSRWTWSFSTSYLGSRAAAVLDGTRTDGECKIFAGALALLATFPPPLGLGLAVKLVTHEPPNGFFASHPTAGVYGLPNDTKHPMDDASAKPTQPLCFWTNHKVVHHGGKYYDPSYGATYSDLEGMEVMRVTGVKKKDGKEVLVKKAVNDRPQWTLGKKMYMREVATPSFLGYVGPYTDIA
jgi:hypothetical protein